MPCPPVPRDAQTIQEIADRYTYVGDGSVADLVNTVQGRSYLVREEFLRVAEWKTPRIRPKVAANSDAHIEEATRIALSTPVEEMRTGALLTLAGVGFPVASTFLHWFHNDPYPILDFRAMEALGMPEPKVYTPAFWKAYVTEWRELLRSSGVDKRTLDRALWQWSKEWSSSPKS